MITSAKMNNEYSLVPSQDPINTMHYNECSIHVKINTYKQGKTDKWNKSNDKQLVTQPTAETINNME